MQEQIPVTNLTENERLHTYPLEEEIPGLQEEIHHTKNWRYREDLRDFSHTAGAITTRATFIAFS